MSNLSEISDSSVINNETPFFLGIWQAFFLVQKTNNLSERASRYIIYLITMIEAGRRFPMLDIASPSLHPFGHDCLEKGGKGCQIIVNRLIYLLLEK